MTPLGEVPRLLAAGFDTDVVSVVLALGKDGGFGDVLGKVFEDLLPEDFLITGGGPEESDRDAFTRSVEEDKGRLVNPW